MKPDSFFILRWWENLSLQIRLFVIFTSLFLFSTLILSVFLLNLMRMADLNRQAQAIYERNHLLYELKTQVGLYELNTRQFEISASQLAEQELSAISERMDGKLALMRRDLPPAYLPYLDNFKEYKEQLLVTTSDITQAVYQQERMSIEIGDVQAKEQVDLLYQQTDAIQNLANAELQAIKQETERFKTGATLIQWLALPLYLLLAVLAAQIIYNQIDQPLENLARASEYLQAGKFDPARLEKLAQRTDEVGAMTREFLTMATNLQLQSSRLQQEAEEIRAKIR
jgi:nitrogen fixation/metabolism regulation signal transduction histidine kinase